MCVPMNKLRLVLKHFWRHINNGADKWHFNETINVHTSLILYHIYIHLYSSSSIYIPTYVRTSQWMAKSNFDALCSSILHWSQQILKIVRCWNLRQFFSSFFVWDPLDLAYFFYLLSPLLSLFFLVYSLFLFFSYSSSFSSSSCLSFSKFWLPIRRKSPLCYLSTLFNFPYHSFQSLPKSSL